MLKNRIKLVCSDIDGTLIKSDKTIGELTYKAIHELVKRGIHFALVTGRFKTGVLPVMETLSLTDKEISGVYDNGAYVEVLGQPTSSYGVSIPLMLEVSKFASSYNARSVLFSGEEWVVEEKDKWWARINGFYEGRGVCEPFEETVRKSRMRNDSEPIKLVLRLDDDVKMAALKKELNILYPSLSFFLSHPDILEVSLKEVNKASGVSAIADKLGITKDQIMSFGNFDNDVPMLKEAGFGVAMKNGTQCALDAADYIAPSNEEDGVGKTLFSLLL